MVVKSKNGQVTAFQFLSVDAGEADVRRTLRVNRANYSADRRDIDYHDHRRLNRLPITKCEIIVIHKQWLNRLPITVLDVPFKGRNRTARSSTVQAVCSIQH